jgi:hypothetical protein
VLTTGTTTLTFNNVVSGAGQPGEGNTANINSITTALNSINGCDNVTVSATDDPDAINIVQQRDGPERGATRDRHDGCGDDTDTRAMRRPRANCSR